MSNFPPKLRDLAVVTIALGALAACTPETPDATPRDPQLLVSKIVEFSEVDGKIAFIGKADPEDDTEFTDPITISGELGCWNGNAVEYMNGSGENVLKEVPEITEWFTACADGSISNSELVQYDSALEVGKSIIVKINQSGKHYGWFFGA